MLYLCGRYTWSPGWYCVLQISPLQSYFPGLQHPHAFHTILFERKSQFTNLRSSNFAPLPWGQNIHINYLKFLCMWGLFASFIHLVVMTPWYGLMYIYFKPWVIIRYFFICFVAQIGSALALRHLSGGFCVPLMYPHQHRVLGVLFCFCLLSTTLLSVTTRYFRLILNISCLSLRIGYSSKEPWCPLLKRLLETTIWALGVVVITSRPSQVTEREVYVCVY